MCPTAKVKAEPEQGDAVPAEPISLPMVDSPSTQYQITGLTTAPIAQDDLALFAALGGKTGAKVVVLLHGRGAGPYGLLDTNVYHQLHALRPKFKGENVVLVIDSPGGQADAAYKIARMFQRSAKSFRVAIPSYAKSAATLLSLGASALYMGSQAEIGPLDVQLFTSEREEWGSALDEVQSLDRITEAAITQADQAMMFLVGRTGKKIETLLPHALDFAAKLQRPMVEKIDTIHFTQQSRILKVAQDYAVRLLAPIYSEDIAQSIASRLVNGYPEHGFVIDKQETSQFLNVDADVEVEEQLDELELFILRNQATIVGLVEEVHAQ